MAVLGASALAIVGLQAPAAVADTAASAGTTATAAPADTTGVNSGQLQAVCSGSPSPGLAECLALRYPTARTFTGFSRALVPAGYGPADLQSAYSLPADGGAGQTIAIVDAYDDPSAESDLAVYRQQYGLPACTTANGCFQKTDQRGGTNYPQPSGGWAGEISLDLDMVSAVAPNAHIVLVETDSSAMDSLGAGVDEAVALGAKFVSNSYGMTPENSTEVTTEDAYYNHPGVAVVAASGDSGYGIQYPAASPYVTAVGGTTLTADPTTSRGWTETVWNRGGYAPGSGCSAYEPKPSFQKDTGCANRTVADVSAVADNVAVYETFGTATPGWNRYGGTSVATPVIAGVYADAGAPTPGTYPNTYPYAASAGTLNDITSGNNGTCTTAYLCNATTGYDGPTGLGTPDGLAAFSSGPKGTLSGTVTDAATGRPIGQVAVSDGLFTTHTDAQGHYSLTLPVGDDAVTADAFGYAEGKAQVAITEGGSTIQDLSLTPLHTQTVTGKVTDGSGHGWPLYAKVSVDGDPNAPVWTDPTSGVYKVPLPVGAKYTLHAVSSVPGYDTAATTVTVGQTPVDADIALTADAEQATAPGYALQLGGQKETFDSAVAAPTGWSVVNAAGSNHGWEFTDHEGRGNLTGGSGNFAIADSDYYGGKQDSQLVSPTYDLSGVGAADLSFDTSFISTKSESMDVDVSTDGGADWSTVWAAPIDAENDYHVTVPLTGLVGDKSVQVRFHYTASWSYYWQVDDVAVTTRTLAPTPGGLIVGTVKDADTGAGVVGATVATPDAPSVTTLTTATPDDPKTGDGFFTLFTPNLGQQTLSAGKNGYTTHTRQIVVSPDTAVQAQFTLQPTD